MVAKSKYKPDNPAQYKRFRKAAREAGADETRSGADRAFKKVVSATKGASPKKRSGSKRA